MASYYYDASTTLWREPQTPATVTATGSSYGSYISRATAAIGDPGTAGGSGAQTFTARLNVTSIAGTPKWGVVIARVQSVNPSVLVTPYTSPQMAVAGPGLYEHTFTADIGAFTADDRLYAAILVYGPSAKTSATISAEVGGLISLTAPWWPDAPARRPIRSVQVMLR